MIKIIKKQIEVVTEYDVEPKVTTVYYVDKCNKNIIKLENCVFQNALPVGWGASDANEYLLKYEIDENYLHVRVDITTGIVKDYNEYFFDYEQAESIHKKRRIEFLKDRIKGWKEYQQELEELEKEDERDERKA